MEQDCQSVEEKKGMGGWGEVGDGVSRRRGGAERSSLSAEVFLCRVSHIFPLLAVALVVWLVALMTLGAGGGALLPVVATLLVRPRHPGLEKGHAFRKNK